MLLKLEEASTIQMEYNLIILNSISKLTVQLKDMEPIPSSVMRLPFTDLGNFCSNSSDFFIPAAVEKSVNAGNAHRFECKLIV